MLFKSKVSFLLISIFTSSIFIGIGFSQQASYLDSLDGKFALQFQINENFRLSNFQGTVLSGKYHFSTRDAVRLGVSLSFSDSEGEVSSNVLDTTNVNTNKIENSGFGITLNTQYIRYIKGTDDISLFVGVGPFINYLTSTSTGENRVKQPAEKYKDTRDHYTLGMDLLVGVEWWFHKYMSLSAEYGMKFMYSSRENTIEQGVLKQTSSENYFRITANSINFGITVYF